MERKRGNSTSSRAESRGGAYSHSIERKRGNGYSS